MSTFKVEQREAKAESVRITEDTLAVDLFDGRTISVPLAWFPRLLHGTPKERNNWRLIARGEGIHWPELDEDISIEGLLEGRPSGESQSSLQKWLAGRKDKETSRKRARNVPLKPAARKTRRG
jgi:Protein of unknown function (DUF2442)